MASKSLPPSAPILIISSLLLCLALSAAVPCDQPKIKPAPAVPKKKQPAIPKIIRPKPSPAVQSSYCPKDTVKFGVCSNILGIGTLIGSPVSSKCCALLTGLTDVEAAACLCTAIKANVLGVDLDVPVSLSLLISSCQKTVPTGYQCN